MKSSSAEVQYRIFEQAAWERAAEYYADSFGTVTAPFAGPLLDTAGCSPGTRILEIASASGYISDLAASRGAIPTGVDFSAAMVAEARKRHPSIPFSEADAENLPFPDESFDAVVIGFGVNHFPRPQLALSEARRVLRQGGRLAFTVWSSTDNTFQQLLLDAIAESGARGSALPAPPQGDVNRVETCMNLLLEAGFDRENSSVRKLETRLAIVSAEKLLEVTEKGTAKGSALIQAQPDELRPAIIANLEQAMEQYRTGSNRACSVPAVALLAVATRR